MRPGVTPVQSKQRFSALKQLPRVVGFALGHALGRNVVLAYAVHQKAQALLARRRVHAFADVSARAPEQLEEVTHRSLNGRGLKVEPLQVSTLGFSNFLRGSYQFIPGFGYFRAVLLEQILAVIQELRIGEGGQAVQFAAHSSAANGSG